MSLKNIVLIFLAGFLLITGLFTIWLLFDGWFTNFNFILGMWDLPENYEMPNFLLLMLFSLFGAILGGTVLSVISFHRYVAVEKTFDLDHVWGFIFNPMLSAISGIVIYAFLQSGLVILSGDISENVDSVTSTVAFTAIGCVAGFNWDVLVKKIQHLSESVIK
jgi:hypothetical protein